MRKNLAVIALVLGLLLMTGCWQEKEPGEPDSKSSVIKKQIKSGSGNKVLTGKKTGELGLSKTVENRGEKIMVESKSPEEKEMQDVYDDIEKEIQGLMSDLEQLQEDSSYLEKSQGSPEEAGS